MGRTALRAKTLVWLVVAVLALTAGLTAVLWVFFSPDREGAASMPVPQVTVTAGPDEHASVLGTEDGTEPITAQGLDEQSAGLATPEIVVGPGVDLSQHSIDDPASPWVVVNKTRPLDPQMWEPTQLETVGGTELAPQAAAALQSMIDAASQVDLVLNAGSGYRSFGVQESIYADYAAQHGAQSADRFSARPGHSEHQTGWAVDVYASEQCRIQECFAEEPAGMWLAEHAHEYGFVIRYPRGAESVTGFRFEPWHIRYVGQELATGMREHGIATLEEAFGLPASPSYD